MYEFELATVDWMMISQLLIVMGTGVVVLMLKIFQPLRQNNILAFTSVLGLIAAGVMTAVQMFAIGMQLCIPVADTLAGMVFRSNVSLFFQLILIGICLFVMLFSEGYLREKGIAYGEFYPLALWATAGGMILVSTKSLLMLFIGLEVLSISLYILAGMSRQEKKSEESAIKYFMLGAFASGFLLLGIAYVFGATGSLQINDIAYIWEMGDPVRNRLLLFGLGLILMGVFFKLAVVPFHQWVPDVYQGAPTNVTLLMAASSKTAAIGAMINLFEGVLPLKEYWMPLLFWLSILTMTVGNLVALLQKDVKRTLAYSSISHAGYLLVALLAHFKNPERISLGTTMFYLLSYALTTVGAFAVLTLLAKAGREKTRIEDLRGLFKHAPFAAFTMVIIMLSMVGLPPTVGFFGKFLIVQDALKADLLPLVIVLAINSIISVYYYLGIAYASFREPSEMNKAVFGKLHPGLVGVCLVSLVGVLLTSIYGEPLCQLITFLSDN